MVSGTEGDTTTFLVISLGAGTVLAICGAIVAWLKWRHPREDK